jgi:hypothetical protein
VYYYRTHQLYRFFISVLPDDSIETPPVFLMVRRSVVLESLVFQQQTMQQQIRLLSIEWPVHYVDCGRVPRGSRRRIALRSTLRSHVKLAFRRCSHTDLESYRSQLSLLFWFDVFLLCVFETRLLQFVVSLKRRFGGNDSIRNCSTIRNRCAMNCCNVCRISATSYRVI